MESIAIKTESDYTSVISAIYQKSKLSDVMVDKDRIDGNLKELRSELMSAYWSNSITD